MSDRILQSKNTTTPTFTPPTVTPLCRSFTLQPHTAEPQTAAHVSPNVNDAAPGSKHNTQNLQTQLDRASRYGHNLGRIQAKANRQSVIQPKLTIGQPGDKYEQEADRVADRVMAMSIPSGEQQVQRQEATEEEQVQTKSLFNTIQLQAEEDEEQIQTKSLTESITPKIQLQAEQEEQIQTKSVADSITPLIQRQEATEEDEQVQTKPLQLKPTASSTRDTHSLESRLSAQKGSGSSLSNEARAFMEPRFGVDFGQVRIHTSSEAVQMNRELNAQAFAHGSDIYFGAGKYNPSSGEGKRLLAHELTHVVQQTGGVQRQMISTQLVQQVGSQTSAKNTPVVPEKADVQVQRFRKSPRRWVRGLSGWKSRKLGRRFKRKQKSATAIKSTSGNKYQVQPGDTLVKIAAKFRVSIEDLKAKNASKLKTWSTAKGKIQGFDAGELIIIPKAKTALIPKETGAKTDITSAQPELAKLMAKERLTSEEMQVARQLIAQESDQKRRGDLYEALQSKIEYRSQSDNQAKDASGAKIETQGGKMCNLTSLAMCLSYLGVSNPYPQMQFEDALEKIRSEKNLGNREAEGWENVAKELGVTLGWIAKRGANIKEGKDWYVNNVQSHLRQGHAVMMSITGHIVRLQAVKDTGLVVDDPYGRYKLKQGAGRQIEAKNQYNTSGETVGEDVVWSWSEVAQHSMLWIAWFSK